MAIQKFWKHNGLSVTFGFLFMTFLVAQSITGWKEYNGERQDDGIPPVTYTSYFSSGHFLQATFENWESEFLQMTVFIILSVRLFQKGSSESKSPYKKKKWIASLHHVEKTHPGL